MKRREKGQSDDSWEIGNWFWTVLILTTLACLSLWFAPNPLIGKLIATFAATVGWFYVLMDTLAVNRLNKQRREESLKNKEGGKK